MHHSYLDAIKSFEGYTPKAQWDYAQFSNGYGTKALYPGEAITPEEAEKRFAAEGGRLVFIGENSFYYGQAGLALQNAFLASLGSEMVNVGDTLDCRSTDPFQYFTTPAASLRSNPLLTGVASLRYVCASQIIPGPNDASIFYDVAGTHLLAGVAKIDVTTSAPLPAPPPVVGRPTVAGGGAGTRRR